MNKNSSGVRGERRTEPVDVAEMEVGRPSNVIDMRGEGEGAVEDDTQTLNLRGGKNGGIIDGNGEIMEFV